MPRFFALIPAAGTGARMGSDQPKQYLSLAGRPVLFHALNVLCRHSSIERVFVVLAPGDAQYARLDWSPLSPRMEALYCGGKSRAATVFNGLMAVRDEIDDADWVLVHDAARPCLPTDALDRLIGSAATEAGGGLLALPVVDTLKRADGDEYALATESRDGLWQAQTPQMFRYRVLVEALHAIALDRVTDEASAVENMGIKPKLVRGDTRNLKITYPGDLELAEAILELARITPTERRNK